MKIYAVDKKEVAAVLAVPVRKEYEDLRDLVAHSISLTYEEKLDILYGLSRFSVPQLLALYEILEKEKRQFQEINARYAAGLDALAYRPHIVN